MVANKSKTSLIRIQKIISVMMVNNEILVLVTGIILSSSFVLYNFRICRLGSFPIMYIFWLYICVNECKIKLISNIVKGLTRDAYLYTGEIHVEGATSSTGSHIFYCL